MFLTNELDISRSDRSITSIVAPTAIFTNAQEKWADPWSHPWNHPATKRYDYWSYSFITSVIGEFTFKTPGTHILWLLLGIHAAAAVFALRETLRSNITKLAASVIVLAHAAKIGYTYQGPYAPCMDFRFIAWTWLAWSILYASSLNNTTRYYPFVASIFILGIAANIYTVLTVTGSY